MRPPKFATDTNGRPIDGLSLHKSSGRFYATYSSPRTYFGKDLAKALILYRAWLAKQGKATVQIVTNPDARHWPPNLKLTSDGLVELTDVDEATFAAAVRQWILQDVYKAAAATGLPLDRLASLPEPPLPIKLSDIWNEYLNKPMTKKWIKYCQDNWNEFLKLIDCTNTQQITVEKIRNYKTEILNRKKSPTYSKHKFGLIKAVFNTCCKEGYQITECKRILDMLKMLVNPKPNGVHPHPISKSEFQAMLNIANPQEKAILLLGLNLCLHSSEIGAILKSEIDFENRTFVSHRNKNGILRIGVLWERTVNAVNTLPKHTSPYLLKSARGDRISASRIQNIFYKLRNRVDKSSSTPPSSIRDGAYTAACCHDERQARLLAGHKSNGWTDNYVARNPNMVSGAVKAIEDHYFS